ncbi:MAG: thioesterase family protein [Ktedonobacteraceae bacterium]|nr:thioesterase family protein [Ktedonobacteraceae bacterium]
MRPIPEGYKATFEIIVTAEMTVNFEELGSVHPVYATYWMVKHMELAGRKIILPFLEDGEEGIGYEVKARHLASALPGMRVRIVSEHLRTERNRVYARCQVYNELEDLIGEGETTQVVLAETRLEDNFAELRRRWERHQL